MDGTFPFVDCPSCEEPRLAYGDLRGEELVYICFWCGIENAGARFLDDAPLWALGLCIAERPKKEPPLPKKSGCAKACSSSRAPKASAQEGGGCGGSCSCGTKAA